MIESALVGGATLDPRRSACSSRFPAVAKVWEARAQAASQGGVSLRSCLDSDQRSISDIGEEQVFK